MTTVPSQESEILQTLNHYLTEFGNANDAEDHGYASDAQRIRQGARESISNLLQENPFLSVLFPNLEQALSTQALFDFGWSSYCDSVSARLQAIPSENSKTQNLAFCAVCSQLKEAEYASQKYGWPENDTFLPAASTSLVEVRELKPVDSRTLHLWQCPHCGTYYLYKTDYEYLVNGTEDEQSLIRLSPEQAAQYLAS